MTGRNKLLNEREKRRGGTRRSGIPVHGVDVLSHAKRFSGLIRKYSQRIVDLSTLSVEDRIRVEIQRLAYEHVAARNEARITPAPTLEDIASRIGTTREAVSREIARLSRDSVVAREHGDLVIHDLGRLNEMVEALVV